MSSPPQFPRSNPQPPATFDQFLTVPIGKGSYGTVFRGIHKKSFQKYAIKEIFKKGHERFIHYQLQIMYSIDCQYIVRLHDHFETQTSVCLLMEYIEGKQLFDGVINKRVQLGFREVAKIIYQLCLALQYIHELRIIHRDVKPENIIMTKEGKVKLVDFGAANYLVENEQRKTFIGTPQYMAPELLYENEQSAAVDIWAVGVILFQLTTMKLPFNAKTTPKIYENIKNIKYEFPVSIERDHDLKELIRSILVGNPKERPSVREIMNHRWVQKNMQCGSINEVKEVQQIPSQEIKNTPEPSPPISIQKQKQIQGTNRTFIQHQIKPQRTEQQKYRFQLQKKISLMQSKVNVSKKLRQRKERVIDANRIHMKELEDEINSHNEFKLELEAMQAEIRNGDQRYFAALEERTKLKAYENKLKEEISQYKVLKRKSSFSGKQSLKGRDIVTASTISSNRVLSEQRLRGHPNQKPNAPLQKSLSFSILQIQTLLSEIREKKQAIASVSSTHLLP